MALHENFYSCHNRVVYNTDCTGWNRVNGFRLFKWSVIIVTTHKPWILVCLFKKTTRGTTRETVAFFPASRHHKTHEPFVLSYTRKNRIEHAMICLLSSTGSSTKKVRGTNKVVQLSFYNVCLPKKFPFHSWLLFEKKDLNRKCRYEEGILLCGAFDLFCKEKLLRSLTRFGKIWSDSKVVFQEWTQA